MYVLKVFVNIVPTKNVNDNSIMIKINYDKNRLEMDKILII